MWDTGRVGGLDYPANASVNGVLWRHCPTTVRSALWVLLGLAVIVAGWLLLPRHLDEARRSDDLVTTVAVSASVMLLIPGLVEPPLGVAAVHRGVGGSRAAATPEHRHDVPGSPRGAGRTTVPGSHHRTPPRVRSLLPSGSVDR